MKRVIRHIVWETNSSMTHSCAILNEDKYNLWRKNTLYLYWPEWDDDFNTLHIKKRPIKGNFYTEEEAIEFVKKKWSSEEFAYEDEDELTLSYNDFFLYEDWNKIETSVNYYTTDGGEKLVIVCRYGTDY